MRISHGEGSCGNQRDEQVLFVFYTVRLCAHDLVDRTDFGALAVVQPFLSELGFNLKHASVTPS